MKDCLDLYSRLIVATITFVGPIIIFLLSTFSEGHKRRIGLAQQTEEEISKKAKEEMQVNPANFRETVERTSSGYKKIDRETKKELKRLNPIAQFWNIYGTLSGAFLLLLFDYLVRSDAKLYNHSLSSVLILCSILIYGISLFFITRVFYTINKTKKIIDAIN